MIPPSFTVPPFVPHPLLRGGHRQTVAAAWGPRAPQKYQATRFDLLADDGDRLAVHDDVPVAKAPTSPAREPWQPGDPLAILFHGLGGCHQSSYITRLQYRLNQLGVRTWRVDQRGFGHSLQCRQLGHAGRSEDVQLAVSEAIERAPGSPIWLFGFSMGANLVLKAIGQWSTDAPSALVAAAAVAPPIDLLLCAENMKVGWNRVYSRRFVKRLMKCFQEHQHRGEFQGVDFSQWPSDLMELDDRFTAPLSGYDGALDYYHANSSGRWLDQVTTPTFILAAADDPVVPAAMFQVAASPCVKIHLTDHGGHVGFFGTRNTTDVDRCWLDWRLLEWFQQTRRCLANSTP